MNKLLLCTAISLVCAEGLNAQSSPGAAPSAVSESKPPQVEKHPPPLDPQNMDTSVQPKDDFYLYANGGWIKRNPTPPEFARWGSFIQLAEQNNDALREIVEKASATASKAASPDVQTAVFQQAVRRIGVRTKFYPSSDTERRPYDAQLNERR